MDTRHPWCWPFVHFPFRVRHGPLLGFGTLLAEFDRIRGGGSRDKDKSTVIWSRLGDKRRDGKTKHRW